MARWVFVAYSILFVLGEADTKRIVLLACWAFAASAEEIGEAIRKRQTGSTCAPRIQPPSRLG